MIEVIAFPHRRVGGWPEHDDARVVPCAVPKLLSARLPTDVHFTAYASDVPRRLTVDLLRDPANAGGASEARPRMVLAVFDVDDPVAHETHGPARMSWRDDELPKLEDLIEAHPGAFLYSTRGGHRIVYALEKPTRLLSAADDAAWTARYKSWCRYLKHRFDISADPSCADWTRLYRAPFVVRDGVQQEPSTFGDASALGTWTPKLAKKDRVAPKKAGEMHGAVEPVPIADVTSAYGHARIGSAVSYLQRAPLSIEGDGGRNTFFSVCCYLVRRLRLPHDVASECIALVYNPRLVAAGTTTWDLDEIEDRLESAARTSSAVPAGEVDTEADWMAWQEFLTTGKVAS